MASKLSQFVLAAGLATAVSAAWAVPVVPNNQPIQIQFTNAEQVCGTNCITSGGIVGEGNWGIVNVSSMQTSSVLIPNRSIGGSTGNFFSDVAVTHSEGQISGIFYGVTLTSATTTTGGFLDLYFDAPGGSLTVCNTGAGYVPGNRTGGGLGNQQYTNCTDGVFLARLAFNWGIDNTTTTFIQSSLDPTGLGGGTAIGIAQSFADIVQGPKTVKGVGGVAGVWDALFNTDYFNVGGVFTGGDCNNAAPPVGNCPAQTRDFRFRNIFNDNPTWNDFSGGLPILGLSSTDPATTFSVPEPTSTALLGLGLLGLAAGLRRRRK